MRKILMAALATAAFGSASLLADTGPAQAASLQEALAKAQQTETATAYTQYRTRTVRRDRFGNRVVVRRDYGRPAYGQRYYGNRYYGDRYYRRNNGASVAAGIAGLATGAIIGGALAQQQAPVYAAPSSGDAYCAQRYRSYDPASGTYLGYDGVRRSCP